MGKFFFWDYKEMIADGYQQALDQLKTITV